MAKSTEKGAERDPAVVKKEEANALKKQRDRLNAVLKSGKDE